MRYAFTFYWNAERDATGVPVGFIDGYQPGHQLEIAYRGFVEINQSAKERLLGDLEWVAETLFAVFNDDDRRPGCYRGPSMSVGSVIEVQGICFAVAPIGLKRVEIWRSEIRLCDQRWSGAIPCPDVLK